MKKHTHSILGRLLCIIIAFSMANGFNSVTADDLTWNIIQITDDSVVDEHPVISLDAAKTIHMAWAGGIVLNETLEEDLEIIYAVKKANSEWKITKLTDNKVQDLFPQLAVDSNGAAHLTWWSEIPAQSNEIFYATNDKGSWEIQTITQDNKNDIRPTITVDSEGVPNIAWQRIETESWDIYFAKLVESSWEIEPVTEKSTNCYSPSIVFDELNDPYIAWWEQSGDNFQSAEIFYGVQGVGYWKQYQVTGNSFGERDPILVFDSLQRPRMVWTGQTNNNDVLYAENAVACSCVPWDIFQLTNHEDHDEEPHLFVGNDDRLHLVWERGGEVHYARGYSESASWETMQITTGHNPWIYVDQSSEIYVAYFDNPKDKMASDIFLATTKDDLKPPQTSTVKPITTSTSSVGEFSCMLTILSVTAFLVFILRFTKRKSTIHTSK